MTKLTAKHVVGTRSLWSRVSNGGLIRDTLIVQTDLALDPQDIRYDAKALATLDAEVVAYAQSLGNPFKSISYEQV